MFAECRLLLLVTALVEMGTGRFARLRNARPFSSETARAFKTEQMDSTEQTTLGAPDLRARRAIGDWADCADIRGFANLCRPNPTLRRHILGVGRVGKRRRVLPDIGPCGGYNVSSIRVPTVRQIFGNKILRDCILIGTVP